MQQKRNQQAEIRLGSHGEDYGSWMSNPVLYTIGGILVVTGAVASLASTVFHVTVLSGLALITAISLLLLLCWCGWIRRQYAFGGGGMMERVHHTVLSYLDFTDESVDAVVSNYVYHNITSADKRALLMETLRVLKKGGVFALNDEMKPRMYGDMEEFAQELRDMGYQ